MMPVMPGDPLSTARSGATGTADSARPGVMTGVQAPRWAPSFFGVVPQGGVRRRPSDLISLGAAVLFVVGCVVVTDGFTTGAHGINDWLSDLPRWLDTIGTWLYVLGTVGAVIVVIGALALTRNFRLAITVSIV